MLRRASAVALALLALAGCATSAASPGASPQASASLQTSASPQTSASLSSRPASPPTTADTSASEPSPSSSGAVVTPEVSLAQSVLDGMTEAERVGQLLMVHCPSTFVAAATIAAIQQEHVGAVILDGNSWLSVDGTAQLTATLETDNPSVAKLLIATDQEGGLVQRLRGPGFSRLPSAVDQGQMAPDALESAAAAWGAQLRDAGIRLDLAPVLGTVPPEWGSNPPIGDLHRQFGSTPDVVTAHGLAVIAGLAQSGVDAAAKHFPGLGRVRGNTDTSAGVTDTITTRDDPYLAPFAAAVTAGVPFVMMSTAIYAQIDPDRPAAFSSTLIDEMLRRDLGFGGVVISDDLGSAAQVADVTPADRAVEFVDAGGDMVLTVNPAVIDQMTTALLARATADPAFKAKVDASALRILQAKQALGLLN